MTHIFKGKVNVSVIKIVIVVALLIILCLGYFYCVGDSNNKINALFGGLLTGFIVALAQMFLSWYEYKNIYKLKQMKVKDIRSNRANRDFYEALIRSATKKIDIMGVTGDRFMNDFADTNSNQENMRVLLAAMARGVRVRILIPEEAYLESDFQKNNAKNVKSKLDVVKGAYLTSFDFKYFKRIPTHSIFVVDDDCILGPVFPGTQSKDTPAIHLESTSPFAEQYLKYFEEEWSKC